MTAVPYADDPPAPTAYDLDPAALAGYRPPLAEPPDFDLFWKQTLALGRTRDPVPARFEKVDAGLSTVVTYDVVVPGYGGEPVRAWLTLPAGHPEPLPCFVQFVGYGGGRGLPIEHLLWASAGYAHLVVDARGQGGDTPDPGCGDSAPPVVRGLHDPAAYYYRRVFVDATCAVEAARSLPMVDPDRVAVGGVSQGGGIALAAAALAGPVAAVLCDLPFLCHWSRAVRISDRGPYTEVARWCADHRQPVAEVFATLGYFDGMSFAARCQSPALFSVALMDRVCPPSTVYAAYNHYAGPKDIVVWEFNDHDGGGIHQVRHQLAYLRPLLAGAGADAPRCRADAPAPHQRTGRDSSPRKK
ncbi:acetylxylan esterase [Rhizomonospora bruguierae]|uniref:acetylxylan esterase n=1 Tax=Rhizomonospora bruguierae TaxID=1581705 RepID=UPI001BD0CC8D|nr:acetylxylan esterase [Micromonospora sp. NBRC 107566]